MREIQLISMETLEVESPVSDRILSSRKLDGQNLVIHIFVYVSVVVFAYLLLHKPIQ